MANTRKDHVALLSSLGITILPVIVNIPNKIRKKFGDAKKKTRAANPWAILAALNPKSFWDLRERMMGRRKQYRF